MTEQPVTGRQAAPPAPRAQTMAAQSLVNRIIRGLLRTPLLSRLVGSRLLTVYVVGRKSGRHFAVPVAYTRHEGDLLVGSPFGWGRNLRTGEPVTIRFKGRRRPADVLVLADEREVVDLDVRDGAAERGIAGVQQRHFGGDLNGCGLAAS